MRTTIFWYILIFPYIKELEDECNILSQWCTEFFHFDPKKFKYEFFGLFFPFNMFRMVMWDFIRALSLLKWFFCPIKGFKIDLFPQKSRLHWLRVLHLSLVLFILYYNPKFQEFFIFELLKRRYLIIFLKKFEKHKN